MPNPITAMFRLFGTVVPPGTLALAMLLSAVGGWLLRDLQGDLSAADVGLADDIEALGDLTANSIRGLATLLDYFRVDLDAAEAEIAEQRREIFELQLKMAVYSAMADPDANLRLPIVPEEE